MNLIPPIGAAGLYKLSAPFSNVVNLNISYSCMAVRKISDIQATGVNPYDAYYKPYDIAESVFQSDANSGVCIISLQSQSGLWVYVPSSFIEAYPQLNGIPYVGVALMMHLGALPDSLNLAYLKNTLSEVITANLGVAPQDIQTVITTAKTMVSQDNHISAENARQANIGNSNTDYSRVQQYQNTINELQAKVTQL